MFSSSKIAIKLRNLYWFYRGITSLRLLFNRHKYEHLRCFLIFMGYPRSGSSTLATLLDAHEAIIISHELNVLELINKGFKQQQLFYLIKKNSRLFNRKGRMSTGYPGIIQGQFNGRAKKLEVIGDKKAGKTSLLAAQNPNLLERLKYEIKAPVKCIHIVRNPFDMITTQAYGGNLRQKTISTSDIENATAFCFKKIDTVFELIQKDNLEIYTLRHEDLIKNPTMVLQNLFTWLGLNTDSRYLDACKKHLFVKPNKSREKYNWSEPEIEKVLKKINEIPFLKDYSFSS